MMDDLFIEEVWNAIDKRTAFAFNELQESGVKASTDWPRHQPGIPRDKFMVILSGFAEVAFQGSIEFMNADQRARARVATEALRAIASYAVATEPEGGVLTAEHIAGLIVAGARLGRLPVPGDILSAPARAPGATKGVGSKVARDTAAAAEFKARTGKEPTYSDWERGKVVKGEMGRAIATRNTGKRGAERKSRN